MITHNKDGTVTMDKKTFEKWQEEIEWLNCLRAAGVDNWDGLDYARELFGGEQKRNVL